MAVALRGLDKILLVFTLVIVLLATLTHYTFQAADPSKCQALLEDGFWLNPDALTNWQPAGCMLHTYRPQEASRCLQSRRAVFIGGTTTRHLFDATCKKLDPGHENPHLTGPETNQIVTIGETRLQFVWDPSLDSSELAQIRAGFDDAHARPALTVIGLGHDYIRQEPDLTLWAAQIGALVSGFGGSLQERSRRSDRLVLVPVLEPNATALGPKDFSLITEDKVNAINDVLWRLSLQYGVDTASAFNHVAGGPGALLDGLNPAPKAASVMSDILLNLKCNAGLPKHYPYASTCCNDYGRASWVQVMGFIFAAVLVPVAFYLSHKGYTGQSSKFLSMMPSVKYHKSILIMGLTVVLCWYCDRTNVFEKEQKQTDPSQFFLGMAFLIGASLFTLKTSDKDQPFLNRDQTDEWKGWMQVAILVYHYVGVSKTEYIYNYMRVCPTSYLFMTGFGHTVYFLKKDDLSFKRVVATMLRLNLLNVILAYAMGNDWLLYYFAPLVTWNFFVIWVLLWAGHKYNKNLPFVFGKMVVAALLNTAFYRIPGVLEAAWYVLQVTLRMQGDLREWRFRITLDQYSIFPGMVCAVLFIHWGSMSLPKSPSWPKIMPAVNATCIGIMLWYAWFESTQPSKLVYNTKHTYLSWLPCCAFVILRNSTSWLRRTNNGFFAWVGRGSLETFLLQFHIWLAADTAGLLVIPGLAHQRFVNFLIMTPPFFWVSSHVTQCTGDVINWIMAAESRPALPTAIKSHPQNLPTLNGQAANGDAKLPSGVAMNGQAVDIKMQDPSKLDKSLMGVEPTQATAGGVRNVAGIAMKDLRVRVGVILGAMAVMNWTYYI